ncbi:MAG: DEAD/DEAH box helicase, partial [Nitrospirae bacterium]
PRLQILQWLSLRKKGVKLTLPPQDEEVIESLLNFKGIQPLDIPSALKAELRNYQKEGYYWLSFLYKHRFGACLADDMGLGKTLQTIALLGAIKEGIVKSCNNQKVHLVVVPSSLVFNWEEEIKRFYPHLKVLSYTGPNRKLDIKGIDVVLTTYSLMRNDIEKLRKIHFCVVVFDEAQAIKNIHAATTKAARKLRGDFILSLTGTPVENHIGEYFSIIDVCLPGLMGDYDEFMKNFKKDDKQWLDEVIKRTAPFVLRRSKEETIKELPPKIETNIYLELTEAQKIVYNKLVRELRREIDHAYATMTKTRAQVVALSALLKLRRLCLCPKLLEDNMPEDSPKLDILVDRLKMLKEENHNALVFSQFTSYLDIVEERLKKEGFNILRLDGSTPQAKRRSIVKSFQEDNGHKVFLLSLKAGGQGLNLTKADYVFHLDPWWNPAVEQQATDRTHRIGQQNVVTVIRLLMRYTIEEKMLELKKRKQALYDALLSTKTTSRGVGLTKEDLDFLLG